MKKVTAIALAFVMLFAVAVPAFAAVEGTFPNGKKTEVKVDGNGLEQEATFELIIPADAVLTWGQEVYETSYSVKTHLMERQQLRVTASSRGFMEYTGLNDLPFTVIDVNTQDVINETFDTVVDQARFINILVDKDDWAKAPIAEYQNGEITFTAEVIV